MSSRPERAKVQKFDDWLDFKIHIALAILAEAYVMALNWSRIIQREEEVIRKRKRESGPQGLEDGKREDGKRPKIENFQGGGGDQFGNRGWNPRPNQVNQQNQFRQSDWCRKCNQSHSRRSCKGGGVMHCFTCGEIGHRITNVQLIRGGLNRTRIRNDINSLKSGFRRNPNKCKAGHQQD